MSMPPLLHVSAARAGETIATKPAMAASPIRAIDFFILNLLIDAVFLLSPTQYLKGQLAGI
jgi:hypothetical protein